MMENTRVIQLTPKINDANLKTKTQQAIEMSKKTSQIKMTMIIETSDIEKGKNIFHKVN